MVKAKVRFDGLDVAAMVAHWNRVALGRRVINIYNGPNGDTYLFKLDKQHSNKTNTGDANTSNVVDQQSNLLLLLESGIRFHTTQEAYENPGMPSPFCSKLRKHLRGLRLENVKQLGNKDRVVMMVFGSGDAQRHYLILELYARGNLLLTNSNYVILSLLRSHDYDGAVKVQVGHPYPVTYATTVTAGDEPGEETSPSQDKDSLLVSTSNPLAWYQQQQNKSSETATNDAATKKKGQGKQKKGGENHNHTWKNLLLGPDSGVGHFGPALVEHCFLISGIDTKQQSPSALDESGWKSLQSTLQSEGDRILRDLDMADNKGYIFYQPKPSKDFVSDEKKDESAKVPMSLFDDKLLQEFQPHVLGQHKDMPKLEYESFDRAVDAFFSNIESQKRLLRAETQQTQAEQRLEKIRLDQQQRVDQLRQQQDVLREQAQLVESHADMVDKAIQVVNSALDSGMDWSQLEDLVQIEKVQNQNPVALLIQKFDLQQDSVILRLERLDQGGDQDDNEPTMDISISLHDTAHGNASALYAKYRASKEKGQKTIEASSKALQAAEDNAQRQLQAAQKRKGHLTGNLQTKRKPLWFEKFHWFITADNYLVLAGRDAQQNEQLVKRYLRPGDAYLHADVHGAASCIMRAKRHRLPNGKTQTLPLSDRALQEAGSFTICRSSAWSSRMVTSAWWVESHQVSKTAPSGEYLTVGSFMIRGKKNFLPPTQLEMGLGVLFRLGDEDSIARHKNERRDFALMQLEEEDGEESAFVEMKKQVPVQEPRKATTEETISPTTAERSNTPEREPTVLAPVEQKPIEGPSAELVTEDSANIGGLETLSGVAKDEDSQVQAANACDTESSVPPDNNFAETAPPKPKKGLSVKERKLIKKYGSLEAAQAAEEERQRQEEQKKNSSKGKKAQPAQPPQPANTKRGKKAKMKRMAKRYADQDEEDRELAMLALHAGEKTKKDKTKKTEISETAKEAAAQTLAILKKDAAVVAESFGDEIKETLAKCVTVTNPGSEDDSLVVRWDKFDADILEQLQEFEREEDGLAAAKRLLQLKESTRIDNFSASLAGIIRTIHKYGRQDLEQETAGATQDSRRKTKAAKENEEESWKQTLAEEGVLGDDGEDDVVDDTTELSKLAGKVHNDDLILFAVPVCAPYQSLSQYSYRVKLTPGNMKRGKASKMCVDMFLKDGQKSALVDRNKDLIKKVADNEWVQAICGDVKISAAGASKAIQKQKGKGKSKKKK